MLLLFLLRFRSYLSGFRDTSHCGAGYKTPLKGTVTTPQNLAKIPQAGLKAMLKERQSSPTLQRGRYAKKTLPTCILLVHCSTAYCSLFRLCLMLSLRSSCSHSWPLLSSGGFCVLGLAESVSLHHAAAGFRSTLIHLCVLVNCSRFRFILQQF